MSNYILKYTRDSRVKYISHLDFIRLFHRVVRRSNIQFVFSQGFNPHPIMTIAMPLSVGLTSSCEYMKVGFDTNLSENEIMDKLNQSFPPGFSVVMVKKLLAKEIDLTKINKAKYTVYAELEDSIIPDISKFLTNNEIKVMKKTKSGIKESDIKPYIYELEHVNTKENIITLKMTVACGNTYNLKPETVIDAMEKYISGFKTSFISIHRDELVL